MALRELVENDSGVIEFNRSGASAHREFISTWDDAIASAPAVGSPHPEWSLLTVDRVRFVPFGKPIAGAVNTTEERKVIVDYSFSYRKVMLGDPVRITYKGVTEVLKTGAGRVCDDTDRIIDDPDVSAAIPYAGIGFTVDMAASEIPIDIIMSCYNKVNDDTFLEAAAGTILLKDWGASAEYDYENLIWWFRLTFEFHWREWGHNNVWIPPAYDRADGVGTIQYYQDKHADQANYTTDSTLVSTPVYLTGDAGTGRWTTTTPKNYEEADFSGLLGV